MLNFLEELFLFFNRNQGESSPKLTSFVVGTIFFVSMILLILELNWVFSLLSLFKFIVTFSAAGVLFGFIIYFFLVRLGIIKPEWKAFWTIMISGILLTTSLSSKLNRIELPEQANEEVNIIASPEFGERISRIPIGIGDETFELRTSIENGKKNQIGDKIHIVKYLGKLGFTVIVEEKSAQQKINKHRALQQSESSSGSSKSAK